MPIEGFDYKGFAASMSEQAKQLVPKTLQQDEQDYIVNTLSNFTMLAGEALYNDENLKLSAEQAVFITQVIAEWSFHKSIDLIHSGIEKKYWDNIMQKIAFTIFEVAKQAIIKEVSQEQLLQAVEYHVVQVYKRCIDELQQKGVIDEAIKEQAENQSNIDAMAKQAIEEQIKKNDANLEEADEKRKELLKKREEARRQRRLEKEKEASASFVTKRQTKMMSLAMFLKLLSEDKIKSILSRFTKEDAELIVHYMNMANLEGQIDGDILVSYIREMRDTLPVKRKLTQENVMADLLRLYRANPRENIEKIIKNERPLIKRFIAQAYDGEYSGLPLKVAGIVAQYVEDSI